MKANADELLQRLPGPASAKWPEGERFTAALSHGTMTAELYAPRGHDPQTPHTRDELYFILHGNGELVIAEECFPCARGDAFFVKAGMPHRFENFTDDFATWVVFWGPEGGES